MSERRGFARELRDLNFFEVLLELVYELHCDTGHFEFVFFVAPEEDGDLLDGCADKVLAAEFDLVPELSSLGKLCV